jgi:hypothetical protein
LRPVSEDSFPSSYNLFGRRSHFQAGLFENNDVHVHAFNLNRAAVCRLYKQDCDLEIHEIVFPRPNFFFLLLKASIVTLTETVVPVGQSGYQYGEQQDPYR